MPTNSQDSFISGLLGQVSQGLMARTQRKLDEQRTQKEQRLRIAQAALTNPDVINKDEVSAYTTWLIGDGKPLKPNEMPIATHVANVIAQAKAKGQQEVGGAGPNSGPIDVDANGTPKPAIQQNPQTSGSPFRIDQMPTLKFLSPEQKAQMTANAYATRKAIDTSSAIDLANAKGDVTKSVNAAKPGVLKVGTKASDWEDIPSDERPEDGEPGKQYVPVFIGNKVDHWQQAAQAAPKNSTSWNDRVTQHKLLHPGVSDEEAGIAVANDLVHERATALQQKRARFDQLSKLSDQQFEKNTELMDYMRQNQPLTLAAKQLGYVTSKEKLKAAAELAHLLANNPDSPVAGKDPVDVEKMLRDEGYGGSTAPAGAATTTPAQIKPTPMTAPPLAQVLSLGPGRHTLKNGSGQQQVWEVSADGKTAKLVK